jgi:hypothetical protein
MVRGGQKTPPNNFSPNRTCSRLDSTLVSNTTNTSETELVIPLEQHSPFISVKPMKCLPQRPKLHEILQKSHQSLIRTHDTLAKLREQGDQLYQPLNFSDQQEDPPVTSTPNYMLHDILTNQSEVDIAVGIINPLYQDQLETRVPQSPNAETLILGDGGSGLPPSPPDPSPHPSSGESFDKDISSSD